MSNEYYDHTTYPPIGAAGTSLNARQEFRKIETGLGKLPALAGNGNKIILVNSGGTALTAGASLTHLEDVVITGVASNNMLRYSGSEWVNVAGPAGAIVGATDAQTLTNKTISGASNTITNVGNASLTNSSLTIGSTNVALGATATTLGGLTNVTSSQFNGPVGSTTPAAGVFTTLSASGAFSLSGDQVQISEGGTGQTTAAGARVALLPALATNAGKVLAVNAGATDVEWLTVAGTGTVTSVGGTGTVNGLTLTGTVTAAGNLTLGGTLSGVDLTAAVTGTLPVANGGTGATTLTGILIGNGTSAVSTVAAPTGSLVGTTATQTLTNKTLTDPAITGTIKEDIYTITDGAAFQIDPGNGSVQTITLGASRTPKATNFENGESVVLGVDDGASRTLTWTDATFGGSGVVWETNSGSAPTLDTTGYTWIVLWKVSGQVYGAKVGG